VTLFTLVEPAQFEQDIRRSLFRASAAPVATAQDALDFVRQASVPDATHNCWAFRVGQTYRSDDDGEPGGTAGRPILAVIDGQAMDRIVVVVTRWYGGTKLGAGGLVRAYGGTAAECLRLAPRTPIIAMRAVALRASFSDLARLQGPLRDWGAIEIAESFDATGAHVRFDIPEEAVDSVTLQISNLTAGRVTLHDAERPDGVP